MTRPVAVSSAGVEVGGAVPAVVVGAPLGGSGQQGQDRRGAVEGLYLGFVVHTQHHRRVGRVQVQTRQVADLFHELGVGRYLEMLGPVRLETERPPYS